MVKNVAGKYVADKKQGFKVLFDDFGDSSVDLFVVCWVLVEEKAAFVAKVKEVIYNTLNKNKIEIPFPQQDVYVRHLEMPKYRFQDYEDADPHAGTGDFRLKRGIALRGLARKVYRVPRKARQTV